MSKGGGDLERITVKIEDETIWTQVMEDSEQKLTIVNCHPGWCGPCEAILPTMTRVLLDYPNAEARFSYCTANIQKVSTLMQPTFPSDANVDLSKVG